MKKYWPDRDVINSSTIQGKEAKVNIFPNSKCICPHQSMCSRQDLLLFLSSMSNSRCIMQIGVSLTFSCAFLFCFNFFFGVLSIFSARK